MPLVLALTEAESAEELVAWGLRLAAASRKPLEIVCCREGSEGAGVRKVSRDAEDLDPMARAAWDAVADAEARGTVSVTSLVGKPLVDAITSELANREASAVLTSTGASGEKPSDLSRLAAALLREAPCDVIVHRLGGPDPDAATHAVVPLIEGEGRDAMAHAGRMLGGEGSVTVLVDPAYHARSHRQLTRAYGDLAAGRGALEVRPLGSDSWADAIGAAASPGDLVVLEIERSRQIASVLDLVSSLLEREDRLALWILRPVESFTPSRRTRIREGLRPFFPPLEREQRIALTETLERGGTMSADFAVMLGLSSGIASLGLLKNSVAVVIGAMLVAPLMTPLLAIALGIVQGNAQLFRRALQAMAVGAAGGLLVPIVLGLVTPNATLTAEIVARGTPDLLDLAIALLSGIAGAYALARPGLAGTLVGVAIAVALVPPLAAAGLALSQWELEVAGGAAVLLVTNLVAIVLGAALVYRGFGLRVGALRGGTPLWARRAAAALGVIALILTAPLGYRMLAEISGDRMLSMTRPVRLSVHRRVALRLAEEPGLELIGLAPSHGSGFGVGVTLLAERPVPAQLIEELRALVHAELGADVPVHVYAMQSAEMLDVGPTAE